MSKPVAIVTGAVSGIGLSLTRHLLRSGWRVAMADLNEEKGRALEHELGPDVMFLKVDVAKYDQQAALFQSAFEWGGNRLDFLAANAGIDDRQSLYEEASDTLGPPPELNTDCIQVDMVAVLQGVWLLSHYARRNKDPGAKVVITSSGAGIYPMETNPQYSMAKHGLIGLVRSAAPRLMMKNVTINSILPGFVKTGLAPPEMLSRIPPEYVTPMSTVLRAYDMFLRESKMTGQTVGVSGDQLHFHSIPEYPDEITRWLGEDSKKLWGEVYPVSPPEQAPRPSSGAADGRES